MSCAIHRLQVLRKPIQLNVKHKIFVVSLQAGLRILNIDQENFDLDEVAYFDVYPMTDSLDFGGTWSNYAYLESGEFKVILNILKSHAVRLDNIDCPLLVSLEDQCMLNFFHCSL